MKLGRYDLGIGSATNLKMSILQLRKALHALINTYLNATMLSILLFSMALPVSTMLLIWLIKCLFKNYFLILKSIVQMSKSDEHYALGLKEVYRIPHNKKECLKIKFICKVQLKYSFKGKISILLSFMLENLISKNISCSLAKSNPLSDMFFTFLV